MGFISTKVAAGVLASSLLVGGVAYTFDGGQTVDKVKTQLVDLKDKVVAFDASQGKLLEKIGFIKADASAKLTDANGKIVDAKTKINNLEAEKSLLTKTNEKLTAERDGLLAKKAELEAALTQANADKAQLTADLAAANAKIADLNSQIDAKNQQIASLEQTVSDLQDELTALKSDYDKLLAVSDQNKAEAERANAEVKKANDKVAELEGTSAEVKAATENKKALTQTEIDAISTVNTPDVFSSELVVKNLNLTYIADGQSDAFKSAHTDLDIKPGDRVWRIQNDNSFKVYVEWQFNDGTRSGETVANPNQTFYMTDKGGTMIIKWQDEKDVWHQVVKAGA